MVLIRGPKEPIHVFQTRRHQEAVRLFETTDLPIAQIARTIGVSRKYVSQWHTAWKSGDNSFLVARRCGRQSQLTNEQKLEIREHIIAGPQAAGYQQQLWNQKRIAVLIKHLTGVDYHPNFIRVLMASMGISYQKPELRAKERNEAKVAEFLEESWPIAKKRLSKDEQP